MIYSGITVFMDTCINVYERGGGDMFHTICIACIIIGILIPFCSIVLNLFDGFVDFVSIDVLQLEFGQDIIFGCLGLILDGRLSETTIIIIGFIAGYICAVALQSAIKRLKKVENFAADKEELLLRKGIVSNTIPENGVGAISVQLSTGTNVSYPARSIDGKAIKQDKEVNILRFDGDYVIVQSTSYLEDKYSDIPGEKN